MLDLLLNKIISCLETEKIGAFAPTNFLLRLLDISEVCRTRFVESNKIDFILGLDVGALLVKENVESISKFVQYFRTSFILKSRSLNSVLFSIHETCADKGIIVSY